MKTKIPVNLKLINTMKDRPYRVWIEELNSWGYFTLKRLARDPKMQHYVDISEIICESTELEDKNGKKIFNGDIIKYINRDGKTIIGHVGFEKSTVSYYLMLNKEWSHQVSLHRLRKEEYEIIGNIKENPELLK